MPAKAPERYGKAGQGLWDALHDEYTFRADETPLLVELCRLADDLEAIRSQLADAPLIVAGSKGQDVVNPLRVELHRTSTRFESIVRSLAIPDDGMTAAQARSWAGRNLARQRWGG